MSSQDIVGRARDLVVKLRGAESLILSGKLDEGIKAFREAVKEAREANLYSSYKPIINRIRRLIEVRRARAARESGAGGKP
ncbi:hypothetical protein [Vulcanisaeta thermophila]|uniref:hypothetical protein n=1 Tax=Vulcanisaeta thermophila TaxID=867917 RepID=UPI000852FD8C|nr:hypothetical protein [Vulcanisaeta thermophila]